MFPQSFDGKRVRYVNGLVIEAPKKVRRCQVCGDEMIWLPLSNRWGVLYRWRAWCREHGYARRLKQR